jgi:hypothetical protein
VWLVEWPDLHQVKVKHYFIRVILSGHFFSGHFFWVRAFCRVSVLVIFWVILLGNFVGSFLFVIIMSFCWVMKLEFSDNISDLH